MSNLIRCAIALACALLAGRLPAQITFQFDYSRDTSNFFGSAGSAQRTTLEAAGTYLSSFLTGQTLAAISPGGPNNYSWTSTQPSPNTGSNFTLSTGSGPSIAANTIIIYVGAYDLPTPNQIGFGSQGSWTWAWGSGTNADAAVWRDTVFTRGLSSTLMAPKIGSISFDSLTSWYFDTDYTTVESFGSQYDFFSVAVHELIHVLGQFDGSSSTQNSPTGFAKTFTYGWTNGISGTNFTGSNAVATFGGNVPLTTDKDHWAEGTASPIAGNPSGGPVSQETLMDPTFNFNVRKYITELDLAGLRDMGYTTNQSTILVNINAIPEPSTYALLVGLGGLAAVGIARRRRAASRI